MTKKKVDNLLALTIEQPDDALFKQSQILLVMAESYIVTTPEQAITAGEQLKEIKALAREVESKRKEMTVPINQGLRKINDFFRPAKKWLSEAEHLVKIKLLKYQQDQALIAQEAQRKADEEARKERVKLEKAAALAAQAGMDDRADELKEEIEVQEIETREAPAVVSAAPKLQGISTRRIWEAEVTDKLTFVKYVAENPSMLGYLKINESALHAQARTLKDEMNFPGVKAVEHKSIAARS